MSKSPSLRRIQADIRELALDPSDRYYASPLENDMFEWHFTIRGAEGTDFEGGVYHGRILLPPEYPFKPPHIMFLTPSGRFETNTKICLSFSAYHPELWQPAWGIRLILEALISFLPTPADGAIGALDWSTSERKRLALHSRSYECGRCGKIIDLLPKPVAGKAGPSTNRFQKEIEELQRLQLLEHKNKESDVKNATEDEADTKTAANGNIQGSSAEIDLDEETLKPAAQNSDLLDTSTLSTPTKTLPDLTIEKDEKVAFTTTTNSFDDKPNTDRNGTEINLLDTPRHSQLAHAISANSDDLLTDAVAQQILVDVHEPSWLSDPLFHGITLVLSIIAFLLIRKIQMLVDDIRALD